MKRIFQERIVVFILFVTAFVVFSFAQQDSRKFDEQLLKLSGNQPQVPVGPDLPNQFIRVSGAGNAAGE